MKLDELKTRVAATRAALPPKVQVAKRVAAIEARLKNNARKGSRDAQGRATGILPGKTPKLRAAHKP